MISPSRMKELAEEQKTDYIENVHFKDKFGEFTCNIDKKGVSHCKGMYRDYFTCGRCKNASWYDDGFCNNGTFEYIQSPRSTRVERRYCLKYERKY